MELSRQLPNLADDGTVVIPGYMNDDDDWIPMPKLKVGVAEVEGLLEHLKLRIARPEAVSSHRLS